jgi:DNA-binding transcriptional regulator YbjK
VAERSGAAQLAPTRRSDPGRRDRIIDVTLDVVSERGVAGTTHRAIAAAADIPLGSMTYHFEGMDDLLAEAFTRLADRIADRFETRLEDARDEAEAVQAVVELITTDLANSSTRLRPDAQRCDRSRRTGWPAAGARWSGTSTPTPRGTLMPPSRESLSTARLTPFP